MSKADVDSLGQQLAVLNIAIKNSSFNSHREMLVKTRNIIGELFLQAKRECQTYQIYVLKKVDGGLQETPMGREYFSKKEMMANLDTLLDMDIHYAFKVRRGEG